MLACLGLMNLRKKPDDRSNVAQDTEAKLQSEVESLRAQVEELQASERATDQANRHG